MLKLESSSDNNLKPSVVGLTTALQNLGNEHLSTTDLTKKFGTENVAAALTLIKTADSAEKTQGTAQIKFPSDPYLTSQCAFAALQVFARPAADDPAAVHLELTAQVDL